MKNKYYWDLLLDKYTPSTLGLRTLQHSNFINCAYPLFSFALLYSTKYEIDQGLKIIFSSMNLLLVKDIALLRPYFTTAEGDADQGQVPFLRLIPMCR